MIQQFVNPILFPRIWALALIVNFADDFMTKFCEQNKNSIEIDVTIAISLLQQLLKDVLINRLIS